MSFANDKVSIPSMIITQTASLASKLRESGITNVVSRIGCNFASGNILDNVVFVGETGPGTDYDSVAHVGDRYFQVTFSAGVPVTTAEYVFSAGSVWNKVLTAPVSTSVVRTAATKELDIQSANSGTGDHRAVYAKISLTHASAGSGDALRGYAVANGGVNACRGAHL